MAIPKIQDPTKWIIVTTPGWTPDRWEDLEILREKFGEAGIPTDKPGFFDHPNFIAQEKRSRSFLEDYARFTRWGRFDRAYLERAAKVIRVVAEEMYSSLSKNGSHGQCMNSSMVLSRILDREGIWNYMINGVMTINFPVESGFDTFRFWMLDEDPGPGRTLGHKWVSAPPFEVIDPTIRLQDYPAPFAHLLPNIVLERDPERAQVVFADLASPSFFDKCLRNELTPINELDASLPNFRRRFTADFPAGIVSVNDLRLKYVPICSGIPAEPLEQIRNIIFEGLSAIMFYNEVVAPKLRAIGC